MRFALMSNYALFFHSHCCSSDLAHSFALPHTQTQRHANCSRSRLVNSGTYNRFAFRANSLLSFLFVSSKYVSSPGQERTSEHLRSLEALFRRVAFEQNHHTRRALLPLHFTPFSFSLFLGLSHFHSLLPRTHISSLMGLALLCPCIIMLKGVGKNKCAPRVWSFSHSFAYKAVYMRVFRMGQLSLISRRESLLCICRM